MQPTCTTAMDSHLRPPFTQRLRDHRPQRPRSRSPSHQEQSHMGFLLESLKPIKSLTGIKGRGIKGHALSSFNPPKGLGEFSQDKPLPGEREPPSASTRLLLSRDPPLEGRATPLGLGTQLHPACSQCGDVLRAQEGCWGEGAGGLGQPSHVNEGVRLGAWGQAGPSICRAWGERQRVEGPHALCLSSPGL